MSSTRWRPSSVLILATEAVLGLGLRGNRRRPSRPGSGRGVGTAGAWCSHIETFQRLQPADRPAQLGSTTAQPPTTA